MAGANDLQGRLDDILSGQGQPRNQNLLAQDPNTPLVRPFSEFVPQDQARASALAAQLMAIADQKGGDTGLADAVNEVDRLRGTERPGLLQHAVKLFVTHHPLARQQFRLRPLEQRQPDQVRPSPEQQPAPEGLVAGQPAPVDATAAEKTLQFWREDPLANEHHEHWHLVYPTSGAPVPGGGYQMGSRHGELFAYMHEQMLARYDAERLAVGLPRVEAFTDYRAGIPQGYDPGNLALWDGDAWNAYGPRPESAALSDLTGDLAGVIGASLSDQEGFRNQMFAAASSGVYHIGAKQVPVTIDNLGNTEEANSNSVDFHGDGNQDNDSSYGNHHNIGHVHFMAFNNRPPYGVMGWTATAIRDPIFWRWHKHVDAVYQAFQQNLKPYDFLDGPPVSIRKSMDASGVAISQDIILVRSDGVPANFDGSQAAGPAFGFSADPAVNPWDKDFSSSVVSLPNGTTLTTSDALTTEMVQRTLHLSGGATETIQYLAHEDFGYFIRVENVSPTPQQVTVRVFLAPETEIEDRTAWIEMDRFAYSLNANDHAVLYRSSELSSVVRKPALKPADLTPGDGPNPKTDLQSWCDCGWPYTLLLPRGTADGMAFRLLVMLSPGSDLNLPSGSPGQCSSISYCGLQDKEYPDTREMGYPFNRPFAGTISQTVAAHNNMAWRSIKIRCKNFS